MFLEDLGFLDLGSYFQRTKGFLGFTSCFQRIKGSGSWLMFSKDLGFLDLGSCRCVWPFTVVLAK